VSATLAAVSYEMFVERFRFGEAVAMPAGAFESVFRPYIDGTEPAFDFWHVRVPDGGEADLYARLDEQSLDGLMISRFSTGTVLELLVEFVRRADAVIVPPGCPTLLTDEDQRRHLPDGLRDDAVLVLAGSDVEAVLRSC
jgi:hypothetical protein